ncbi:hypothetical protein Pcaca03_20740 [Pectobacterium carotovorum subsp. carotovorum]|uniref:Uncharacterized protein n=1 Tax=Pectobacterium carotovorum subsp. carotovorum TaxID=555 RepID=A0AAI9L1F4_PECCC|nr:hypothetical protein SOASR016_20670 [Pectobacterium carotovorum subsp. carotovorum]GLV69630.1 hypothetical protein Pcaca03_20740 [Pectobacterium carotovorum subsp. carotovorum]
MLIRFLKKCEETRADMMAGGDKALRWGGLHCLSRKVMYKRFAMQESSIPVILQAACALAALNHPSHLPE